MKLIVSAAPVIPTICCVPRGLFRGLHELCQVLQPLLLATTSVGIGVLTTKQRRAGHLVRSESKFQQKSSDQRDECVVSADDCAFKTGTNRLEDMQVYSEGMRLNKPPLALRVPRQLYSSYHPSRAAFPVDVFYASAGTTKLDEKSAHSTRLFMVANGKS